VRGFKALGQHVQIEEFPVVEVSEGLERVLIISNTLFSNLAGV